MRDKDKLFELYKIFLPIYYNKYVTETRDGYEEAIKDSLKNAQYAYDTFYIKNTISGASADILPRSGNTIKVSITR